ncbi:MAG: sigma-70 family RNA polymerase sigma factor [Candidatus Pacebacteria bacterium]|nr:sigma-70 family RNA polymerase sigma factor [Candidatus Paceibacterota bacterium]MBP9840318.1 sigma-70 family RNA polymerase sigma factor [Candidatus Paceibacterota bacterium]
MAHERNEDATRLHSRDTEGLFEDAFTRYGDELFRHAYLRLSDREKAVDLVQDTFLRAFGAGKRPQDIRDMRAFLYQTLRNLVIDEYRRKKSYSLDAILEHEDANPDALLPTDDTNTVAAAETRLDAKAALAKVGELPPAYAEVILLRFVDGLSPGEIAERIKVSENLVSVRIHRALAALKKLLTPTL